MIGHSIVNINNDVDCKVLSKNIFALMMACLEVLALVVFALPAFAQAVSTIEGGGQATFDFGVGLEHLKIGAVKFGGKYDYNSALPLPLVSTTEQQDGKLNGVRTDAMFSTPGRLFGLNGVVNLKGFYSQFRDRSTLDCIFESLSANCDATSLFDPDETANNTLGTNNAGATYETNRKVQHWGLALEVAPTDEQIDRLQQRLGIGYRAIYQDMHLTSTWQLSVNSQNYHEKLNTHYLGVYWGEGGRHILSNNLELIYSGDAGIYWARTTYDGALNQTDFAGTFSQDLSMKRDKATFIGALDVALRKKFQGFALLGYIRGEYYSYAPEMAYNQTNRGGAGGNATVILGPNDGTHIDNTKAWNVMIGAKLSVPF